MSDLDEEDLNAYGFYGANGGSVARVPQQQQQYEQEPDEEYEQPVARVTSNKRVKDYDDESSFPQMRPRQPQQRQSDFAQPAPKKQQRVSFRDDDDVMLPQDATNPVVARIQPQDNVEDLFKNMENVANLGPVQDQRKNRVVIPYYIHSAASSLVVAQKNREVNLSGQALSSLQKLAACDDEFTMIDPIVVISDTLFTGSCNVYMKEALPISFLILAHHLKLTYTLEVMPGVNSKAKPYTEVNLKPYHGKETKHAQEFGCEEAVKVALKQRGPNWNEMLRLVKIHFARIGPISSADVCEYAFIEAQLSVMTKVLNNVKPTGTEEGRVIGQIDNKHAAESSAKRYDN